MSRCPFLWTNKAKINKSCTTACSTYKHILSLLADALFLVFSSFPLFLVNAAARLVTNTKKCDHITPVLFNLHRLPVFYRIYFKIVILTFKAIYNMSPCYISNLVCIKSGSVYSLRSNSSLILDRPRGHILSTLGARSFYAAAPTLWNSLPANIWDITSLNVFKEKLKTYLFNLAYNK